MELSNYCLINKLKVPTWDEICAEAPTKNTTPIEKQCGRAMFAFFMAHMYLERHRGDLALQAMEKLHKIFPSSVHLYTHVCQTYPDFRGIDIYFVHNMGDRLELLIILKDSMIRLKAALRLFAIRIHFVYNMLIHIQIFYMLKRNQQSCPIWLIVSLR